MRDRLLANWPLKLLALVLAFAIWISITGQDRTVRDVTVPLEVAFGPERTSEGSPPTAVTLRLEGPRTTILKLDPLRVAVRIDLGDAPLGDREIPLSRSDVTGVPRGIDVSLITPDRFRLLLVRRARRPLEIVPELVGNPPEGYALYGFSATPRAVTVEGPESAVDAIRHLPTEAIRLDGHTDRFVVEVGLVPEHPQVRVIDSDGVEVEVLIDAAPVESVFENVRVELPFATDDPAKIRPPTVDLTLSGPPWLIERLEPTQLSAIAQLTQLEERRVEKVPVRVELHLSEDRRRLLTVSAVRPERVSVQGREKTRERP